MEATYSVITVCLNSARTLARTMRSVLAQEPPPIQYLVVDGGSTDGTRGVFDACVNELSPASIQVEWVEQGGAAGIANAWNMGVERSRGSLVFILNSDDWYEKGCAASVCSRFETGLASDILCGTVRLVDPEGLVSPRLIMPRSPALFPVLLPMGHPAVFVRRSVYERVGLFNEQFAIAADYDFLYRCKRAGCQFVIDPSIVVNQQSGGLASRSRSRARREVRDIGAMHSSGWLMPWLAYSARWALGR